MNITEINRFLNRPITAQLSNLEYELFDEALTYPNNKKLAFMGDALITFIATDHLLKTKPEMTNAELHNTIKGNNDKIGIIQNCMMKRIMEHTRLKLDVTVVPGWSESNMNKEKIYGTVFEAIVGAIYLSWGLEKASVFIFDKCLKGVV
jgi:dsRNA-specific ribonuclease